MKKISTNSENNINQQRIAGKNNGHSINQLLGKSENNNENSADEDLMETNDDEEASSPQLVKQEIDQQNNQNNDDDPSNSSSISNSFLQQKLLLAIAIAVFQQQQNNVINSSPHSSLNRNDFPRQWTPPNSSIHQNSPPITAAWPLRQLTFGKDSAASFGNIKNNEKKMKEKEF
uniref:Uncharacterized protein n=1 Tax=Meloidogyne enterolobii TaxID=390850 RepID=A0A6V7URK9_MELEN|nr:unnamed protein product [Meloidogyne enterolobii]